MRPPTLRTLLVVLACYVVLACAQDGWLSPRTPVHLANGGAVLGLAALGQTFVIATGGIDLSVGAVIACSSTGLAVALRAGVPLALAIPGILLAGALLGAFAGLWIRTRGLPPFLVTLALMLGARGLAQRLHEGSLVIAHDGHRALQALAIDLEALAGPGLALGPGALVWLFASGLGAFHLARTRHGRSLLALGGDPRAALLLGVPVGRAQVFAYACSGACSALAGLAATLETGSGSPNAALGLELDAIAAVVIGGAALQGGVASPLGTLLGVLLLGMIQTAITFDGRLGAGWTRIAVGALLLAFLVGQRLLDRSNQKPIRARSESRAL